MSLGYWVISGIGFIATIFMVWVFARVTREQRRQPDHILLIADLHSVPAILDAEAPSSEEDVLASADDARQESGA